MKLLKKSNTDNMPKGKYNRKLITWKVTKSGCWECDSHAPLLNGYCSTRVDGKIMLMHRHIYEQMFGIHDKSLFVLHECDNRSCINPEHLRLGTQRENMKGARERGRTLRGEKNLHCKLTENQVIIIKRMLKNGLSQSAIAKKFNVSRSAILGINTGRTWFWLNSDLLSPRVRRVKV